MVTKKAVKDIIKKYGEAWVKRDSEKITRIFTKNAIYHERAFKKPFIGHKQIKGYWQSKVVGEQSNIKFKLLNLYIDKNNAIAEWEASFFQKGEKKRTHMIEVAILKIKNSKIASLREYWHSERID